MLVVVVVIVAVLVVVGVNKYAQRECAICATRVYLYCIYISCCAGLPTVCTALFEAWRGASGVALPSRVWRKSQKYFVHATEMRKIHFGHWQWVPAACVVGAAPPQLVSSLCPLCVLPLLPPSPLLPLLLQFLCLNIICVQQIRLTAAVSICRSCCCCSAGILTNFQAGQRGQ